MRRFLLVYKQKKREESSEQVTSWCKHSWGLGKYSHSGLVLVNPKQ